MIEFTANKNQKLVKCVMDNVSGVSYSAVMKLLRKKDIKVNGKRVSSDVSLNAGDNVVLYVEIHKPLFPVVFENDDVLVIDKPSGYSSESVFQNLSENRELYFIHRLDRNTSGIMIFAKNKTAESELLTGFKKHEFVKIYYAEVFGCPEKSSDILTAYLSKDAESSFVSVSAKKQKGSVLIKTGYEVISSNGKTSTLKVRLYTGKTHQIRAHLAFIGCPIVGDGKYGNNAKNREHGAKTQMLTAYSLTLKFDKTKRLYYLNDKTFTAISENK
ncbi:MAG: RluA family pseudouridine synthase [Clostridia bacterium]|nr:RluA family pseudouridine synthase [Clostridia bacterium]